MARRTRVLGRLGAFAVVGLVHSQSGWLLVRGQAPATCIPEYSWTVNSAGQTPCQLKEALQQQCGGQGTNTPCLCNKVAYSISFACTLCPGTSSPIDLIPWTSYANDLSCTSTNTHDQYPEPSPLNAPIPSWATLPLNDDVFDYKRAQSESSSGSGPPGGNTPPTQPQPSQIHESSAASTSNPTHNTSQTPDRPTPPDTPLASPTSSPLNPLGSLLGITRLTGTASPQSLQTASKQSQGAHPSGESSVQSGVSSTNPNSSESSALVNGASPPTPNAQSSGNTVPSGSPTGAAGLPHSNDPAQRSSSSHLGAIVGGAVGGVMFLILAVVLATFCVLRRYRQERHRRAREAALASAALDWRKASTICSTASETASMDASTIRPYDGESELQTLEGDDLSEKKSVTYGNYPDI